MQIISFEKGFTQLLDEVADGQTDLTLFWVSSRDSDNEDHLTYATVTASKTDSGVQLRSDVDQISIVSQGHHKFLVEPHTLCRGPEWIINIRSGPHPLLESSTASAIATTASGSILLVGTSQGDIHVFDTSTRTKVASIAQAHYSDVTRIVVFPSDKVFMSVGTDFTTRLWPLPSDSESESIRPARTFQSQKGLITDVKLVGAGRNFLTSSLDGSVNLWECGSGAVVSSFHRIADHKDPALCLCLGEAEDSEDVKSQNLHFDTNRMMFVGYQSGVVQQFHVGSHYQTSKRFERQQQQMAAVTGLELLDAGTKLVAGYEDGTVVMWRVADGVVLLTLQLNQNYAISNLTKVRGKEGQICFSNGPDLLWVVTTSGENTMHPLQLVGLSECFRTQLVCVSREIIVATGDELAAFSLVG